MSKLKEQLLLIISSSQVAMISAALSGLVYHFYSSFPNISRLKALRVGVSLEKNSKLRRPSGKRLTQNQ